MKASDLFVKCLEAEGVQRIDLGFGNPDFVALARAFGWSGHRVNRSRDLRDLLEKAFTEPGPSLIAVPIDYRENALLTERLGDITCPI